MRTIAAPADARPVVMALSLLAALPWAFAQEEPPLPAGLAETRPAEEEPALPEGLLGEEEPGLPPGLEEKSPARPTPPAERKDWLRQLGLSGFWEVRGGVRTQHDRHQKQASIGETRMELDFQKTVKRITFKLTADLLYDAVLEHHTPRLEEGAGFLDLRQANVSLSPLRFVDVKLGRQILTWGTGDLIFINDLFPKDWQSFFIGRDAAYLKAPSDAVKISLFSKLANLNFVYTPRFDADRFIRGRRISFWNDQLGRRSGRDAVVHDDRPDEWFDDGEFAARLYRKVRQYELDAYGYVGYWKSPAGTDPRTGEATFPRLSVYGASARGPFAWGVGNVEVGYYDSRQDRSGDDPFVRNSELRVLAGYEQGLSKLSKDLDLGVQYYLEHMMDYGDYLRSLPPGVKRRDEDRHVLTVRLTKLLMNQNLELSLFAFYSPSDSDAYLRPRVSYKIDDHWTAEVGGNVFFGANPHTFFAQFADNTNVYAALRYGF